MGRLRTGVRKVRERVPLGVLLLGGFSVLCLLALALAVFGPPLPGPNVGQALGLSEPSIGRCDPEQTNLEAPAEPAPAPGRWRAEAPLPHGRDELRAATVGDEILVAGGQTLDEEGNISSLDLVDAYDPRRREYADPPDTPQPLDHAAAVSYRGDLYVVGGYTDGEPSDGLWHYSPEDRTWTELAPMAVARAGHGAAVIGHRMYVVGGAGRGLVDDVDVEPYPTLEVYDFRTETWSSGPDMPTARHHLAVTALGGKVYAIGGRVPGDFSVAAVERYDPAAEAWEAIAPLPQGTGGPAAVAAGGAVVVTGGGDDIEQWVTPATWAFDPDRSAWRRLPDLRSARHGHAIAASKGRIYVFGGAPCHGFGHTEVVESLALD